jgi:putative heme-binding domain-containing protein
LLPRNESFRELLLKGGLLTDENAQVRLATLLALSEMPSDVETGATTFSVLKEPRNSQDRWLVEGATAAAARHDGGFLRAALAEADPREDVLRVVRLVTAHYAQGAPQTIVTTVNLLSGASAKVVSTILEGLIAGWPADKSPDFTAADKLSLQKVMPSLPESARDRLLVLAQRWGRPELFETTVAEITAALKSQVLDGASNDRERAAAAKRWVAVEDKPDTVETVLKQVTLLSAPELGNGMVEAVAESRHARSGRTVVEHWARFTPAVRRTALNVLMRRSEWTFALLEAIQNEAIRKTDLAPEHWAQLKQNPNRSIAGQAERMAGSGPAISADRQELVGKLLPLAREKGDPARGKLAFTTNCAVCHTFNGEGKQVGPDLNGIAARDRAEILLDIIDPNRSVEANYRSWSVTTKDGESYSGRLDAETQTSIEILDATSRKHVIQRKDVATLEASALSIMPSGFELLPADDLKGLIEYLTQPH